MSNDDATKIVQALVDRARFIVATSDDTGALELADSVLEVHEMLSSKDHLPSMWSKTAMNPKED